MNFTEVRCQPLSKEAMAKIQARLDNLAKPVKVLGRLEELADH